MMHDFEIQGCYWGGEDCIYYIRGKNSRGLLFEKI